MYVTSIYFISIYFVRRILRRGCAESCARGAQDSAHRGAQDSAHPTEHGAQNPAHHVLCLFRAGAGTPEGAHDKPWAPSMAACSAEGLRPFLRGREVRPVLVRRLATVRPEPVGHCEGTSGLEFGEGGLHRPAGDAELVGDLLDAGEGGVQPSEPGAQEVVARRPTETAPCRNPSSRPPPPLHLGTRCVSVHSGVVRSHE